MADLVGLNLLADNANLTFIAFIAFVLVAVLGVRFGLYAYWNGRATAVDAQVVLWGYLLSVGAAAAVYGLLGVLRIVLLVAGEPIRNLAGGVMLTMALLVALALRTVYRTTALTDDPDAPDAAGTSPLVALLVVAIVVSTAGLTLVGQLERPFAAVQGLAGVAVVAFGYRFGRRQLDSTRVQGTLLDSLLRHLLPVLLFASLVPMAELAFATGLDRAIVLHVQVVFVIMTATTLMTATIKLRQHLAGTR